MRLPLQPSSLELPPSPEAYEESPQPQPKTAENAAKIVGILAALGGISYGAHRGRPFIQRAYQRRRRQIIIERQKAASNWIIAQEQDALLRSVGALKHLLYTRPGTKLDVNRLPISGSRTALEQLQGLPTLSKKQVTALLAKRAPYIDLSPEAVAQLLAFTDKIADYRLE